MAGYKEKKDFSLADWRKFCQMKPSKVWVTWETQKRVSFVVNNKTFRFVFSPKIRGNNVSWFFLAEAKGEFKFWMQQRPIQMKNFVGL